MNSSELKNKVFCPYCGCGCRFDAILSDNNTIEKILPDMQDTISSGRPCVKGLKSNEPLYENRIQTPMIRENKNQEFKSCTWDDAFSFIKANLENIGYGSSKKSVRDKVYFLASGEATNEANFLLSKLCRSGFASNNIDSCARLCHAATAVAFDRIFGLQAIPVYTFDDMLDGDCFLYVGTDPMEDYPVMFNRVLAAKNNGAKIISVDMASSSTFQIADVKLKITPEGIIPMLCHLMIKLIENGDISKNAGKIEGYSDFVNSIIEVANNNPLSTFGFSRDDIEILYSNINAAKKLVVGFGMGLTQHENGVQNVQAITSLGLLLDAIIFPGRGKVNVQGASDVGGSPFWNISNERIASESWNMEFLSHDGSVSTKALYDSDVKFVWIMESNPSQSMPDLNALNDSLFDKFVIYQHHHPGETMKYANVVLPTLMLSEESGSITNAERRIRGLLHSENSIGDEVSYKAKWCNVSEAKSNTRIILDFAKFMNFEEFRYGSVVDIINEMVSVVPGYDLLTFNEVFSGNDILTDKQPKYIKLPKIKYEISHFKDMSEFPFVFTTARQRFQFCTGEGTGNSQTMKKLSGEPYAVMNPIDADILKIVDGDVVRVVSKVGQIEVMLKLDASVEKRVIVAPYHYDKILVNKLTPRVLDPESGTPCYKNIAVRVEII
ncbi:molybdopterin-dependent oxidoreductase [Candidatus Dojkabacteria bacterium]|nr:molybdopterin-dependent oxidoreductase [Candidatus Dojkabacteria bacterium]